MKADVKIIELTGVQQADLMVLNSSAPNNHRIEAIRLPDGRGIIAADLMQDCGAGQTFAHYEKFLNSLTVGRDSVEPSNQKTVTAPQSVAPPATNHRSPKNKNS